jgi:hypothetical protein
MSLGVNLENPQPLQMKIQNLPNHGEISLPTKKYYELWFVKTPKRLPTGRDNISRPG